MSIDDPAGFPKLAAYRAFGDIARLSKMDLVVSDGLGASAEVAEIVKLNPNIIYMIQPSMMDAGAEHLFPETYGHYDRILSPIADPQLGTIRAYQPSDKYGTVYGVTTFDWRNSGDDSKTAEWTALVKAHFAKQNGAGSDPNIHGIWGDNYLCAIDIWGSEYGNPEGIAWDTGMARHAARMQKIFPNLILGGNDAARAFRQGYAGTLLDGDKIATAGMYESAQNRNFFTTNTDVAMKQMIYWMGLKAKDGRQRYYLFNVNAGGIDRALTSQEKRMSLAAACIAGCHLWIVDWDSTHGSNWWGKTIVPGESNAIPEMGGLSSYPRGWLGKPTSAPVTKGAGLWMRSFEGGTVYLNTSTTTWSIDGKVVPTKDGLFVVGTIAPPPPPPPIPTSLAVTQNIKDGDILSGIVKWQVSVSGETVKEIQFWHDGIRYGVLSVSPYEYYLDTTKLSNGPHDLGLTVVKNDGTKVWEPYQMIVTIDNAVPPPPPPPEPSFTVEDYINFAIEDIVIAQAKLTNILDNLNKAKTMLK